MKPLCKDPMDVEERKEGEGGEEEGNGEGLKKILIRDVLYVSLCHSQVFKNYFYFYFYF